MDIEAFRQHHAEFADTNRYPVGPITFWADTGSKIMSQSRWGDLYVNALELFVAHNLVLEARDLEAAEDGGTVGGVTGAVSSKTVGSVSVSYINESAMEADAGYMNATRYGRAYMRLVRLLGGGCYQL